eukprot:CAMPEP_0172304962 /NCGR_PEP_ID=MMETSP1058-20130122/6295_1 /TAXON_ID=83371 /ORGANISM="Detonula confervacea, Strain CCMP 353" /LENGTH=196 /DNA_ID=CAMNT_0013016369 /DNA_START=91 /DNA_END=678 /DNA_ORIENTATION=-
MMNGDEMDDDEVGKAPELTEDILSQLKRNDPSVKSILACWKENAYINSIDWEAEGGCIGDNSHLEKLELKISEMFDPAEGGYRLVDVKEKFKAFCQGLARNRSINILDISMCPKSCTSMLVEILSPFIEHNSNLSHLIMESCNMNPETIRLLASALSNRQNKSSLRKVELIGCSIGGHEAGELIASLNDHCNLVEL